MFIELVWSRPGLLPLSPTAAKPLRQPATEAREESGRRPHGWAPGLRSAAGVLFAEQTCAGALGLFSRVRLSLDVSIAGFCFCFRRSWSPAFLASFYVNSGALLAENEFCFFSGSPVAFGLNRLEISS